MYVGKVFEKLYYQYNINQILFLFFLFTFPVWLPAKYIIISIQRNVFGATVRYA